MAKKKEIKNETEAQSNVAEVKEETKVQEQTENSEVKPSDAETKENFQPTEAELEFARINMRREFNKRFNKWAVIEQEDADDEYIAETKKDLDAEVDVHKNEVYKISDAENGLGLKYAKFLRDWNKDFNTWEKGEWRGLLKFDVVINGIIEELEKDPEKNFCIDYATLIFLYNTMMKPHGTGLEMAKKMAEYENYSIEEDKTLDDSPVTYSGILERILVHIKYLGAVDKKLNILKQRVHLAYAGLRMTLKIDSLEEFIEFNDAITKENMPSDSEIADAAK